jgi:hypothetical protein
MAKYVLLAFDSDADADAFVADTMSEGYVYGGAGGHLENLSEVRCTVRGVWKKPTQFCQCVGGRKMSRSFTRGLKYGWWVCVTCHKPTIASARGDMWYSALGTNLLPISENAPEYRGPLHKKHEGYQAPTTAGEEQA